ncbi:hypothetical protein JCM16307_00670 [Thermococcus prieurii]
MFVVDTTVLSNFAKTNSMDVLGKIVQTPSREAGKGRIILHSSRKTQGVNFAQR